MRKDRLIIEAEREREAKEGEKVEKGELEGFIKKERSVGKYFGELRLPEIIDCGNVKASFRNGVLKVVLPKKEVKSGRKVEIE